MDIKSNNISLLVILASLVMFPALSFSPCLKGDFTNWDDNHYITENPVIKTLSFDNLKTIFSSRFVAIYCPLVMVSFSLEHALFGLNPFFYHLDNLLLHIINGLLVFWFAYILSRNKLASFITAILFSLHPMKAESVAWISARKDTLSAVFFLLSAIVYARWCLRKNPKSLWLSLCIFVIGLFAKPSVITLPIALLLIDYYLGRFSLMSNIREKIPFFIFGILFSIINVLAQSEEGGAFTLKDFAMFHDNILIGIRGVGFYLLKSVFPFGLCAFYPYPPAISIKQPEFYLSCFFFFFLVVFVFRVKSYRREIFFGFGFFFSTIFLVLKFIPVGDTIAADRYMYIPSIGLFFMTGSIFADIFSKAGRQKPWLRIGGFIAVGFFIGFFFLQSFRQCRIWKNSETLFLDVLKHYPDTFVAHLNLGLHYQRNNAPDKAYAHYKKSLEIKPDALDSLNNMGTLLMGAGKYQDAISFFEKALSFDPYDHIAHYNLGNIFGVLGDFGRAVEHFRSSIRLDSSFEGSYHKLLECYRITGNQAEANALMARMKKRPVSYQQKQERGGI